jgi:fatty-acyl-CoA synthase
VGAVHPHVEIKIIDPDTQEIMQRGERGELCTRGYSVMKGYWNQPELTEASIDSDGWMHSGDLAEMDDAGYLTIVGRIKDMIIRGGENIYPAEIEEFLYSHPSVEAVQVIGVPNEKYGEEVVAWVKLVGDADPMDAEDIREFCRGRIAHFKVPRYVSFVDEFPMTVTGKVRKVAMREASIAELGL